MKKVERIIFKCKICEKEIIGTRAKPRKFCSYECHNTDMKEENKGEKNPAFGKTYKTKETDPDWAESIKKQ